MVENILLLALQVTQMCNFPGFLRLKKKRVAQLIANKTLPIPIYAYYILYRKNREKCRNWTIKALSVKKHVLN